MMCVGFHSPAAQTILLVGVEFTSRRFFESI
jgi:hypothetical protein